MSRECVLEVFVLAFCWETPQIPAEAFSLFAWHGDHPPIVMKLPGTFQVLP